ncbi:MAG: hypothetical protein ABL308_02925 [Oceanicaulis sp.]
MRIRFLTAAATATLALAACGPDDEEGATLDAGLEEAEPNAADAEPGAQRSTQGYTGEENTGDDPADAERTARGGDEISIGGEDRPGPAVEAVAERFGLEEADEILLPTTYRSTADITSNHVEYQLNQGELGYLSFDTDEPIDPEQALIQPRDALAIELTEDRVTPVLGQPVIVTIIARAGEGYENGGQRPALRAAWVEPNGDSSGWRTMSLTEDWQKAVFSYDAPSDTQGRHVLALLPPEGQGVDIAAIALRSMGEGMDLPDPGGAESGEMTGQDMPAQNGAGGMDGEGG